MKPTERSSYLILFFASIWVVSRLYIWFFNNVWDSIWASQHKEMLLFAGILSVFYGIAIFVKLFRSEAWKNLTSENVLLAIIRSLIFQISFWFGVGIFLRAIRLFF